MTPETSKGFQCIEFAEEILEVALHPWQRWALIHALELNPDGTYRFRTILLLVARQNGKSTLMLVLALWRMYVDGAPLVIGTAQNLDISEELWTAAVEMAKSIPELAEFIDHVDLTNGKKSLRLTTGERYKIAAASRRGGRGLSGDLVLLDELREHRNWDAWGAVTKTTMARLIAQVWAASNAGDLQSVVLRHLRAIAHRALGWPDGKDGHPELIDVDEDGDSDASLGILEWSAAPGLGVWDREGWAQANPSLGHTVTEAAIAGAASTDPEPVFRTEVLCQFVDMVAVGKIPSAAWDATGISGVAPDQPVVAAGLKTGLEQTLSVVAAYRVGELDVVDLGFYEAGFDVQWPDGYACEKVVELCRKLGVSKVVVDDYGDGNALLALQLDAAGLDVQHLKTPDARAAAVGFVDAVLNKRLFHVEGQDALTVAALGAQTTPSLEGFYWSQGRSNVDVEPIRTASAAWWVMAAARTAEYDLMNSFF